VIAVAMSLWVLGSTSAKEKPRIKIQVLSSQASERTYSYTTPGRNGTSNTTCNSYGNGTVNTNTYGNSTYGDVNTNTQTNCTTTSTAPTPPTVHTNTIAQEHISAVLPNGQNVTLWCQAGFRKCASLQPGTYEAEITGGSTMNVFIYDLQGKEHKIKYRVVGN